MPIHDPEEAALTPGFSPRILHDPIECAAEVLTPTNNLHSMTSKGHAFGVLVNPTFVVHEVFIDCEANLDSTNDHDSCLNVLVRVQHAVLHRASELLALGVGAYGDRSVARRFS